MNAFAGAAEDGRVRVVGVGNFRAPEMRAAHATLARRGIPLAANQVRRSLLHRAPETDGVADVCRELTARSNGRSLRCKGQPGDLDRMRAEQGALPEHSAGAVAPRLYRKRVPERTRITPRSAALFRFGEQCNNDCPMCSNTGDPMLFFHPTGELLRRAAFLRDRGFKRVVVTGGESTIHPGFWTVIEQLAAYGMNWDTNTHGRSFARPGFAARAVTLGLKRAIVSLHSFDPPTSAAIFGADERAHDETVAGIDRLREAGVGVMLNCVLTTLNLPRLEDYLRTGAERYGRAVAFKFVFPSTIGKGGRWPGVAGLRYADAREPVRRLRAFAARHNLRIFFESFPHCVLRDTAALNLGRSAFGETHYLDDASGDRIYSMRHIESALSAYAEQCRGCALVRRCPGVALAYAERFGVGELVPVEEWESAEGRQGMEGTEGTVGT